MDCDVLGWVNRCFVKYGFPVSIGNSRPYSYDAKKETTMLTPFGYFDLIDEMTKLGCPVCNLLVRNTQQMLNIILYEYVTEPETHATFRASRGLCNVHGWQLTEQSNVMSIAVLYKAVLDEVLKDVAKGKSPSKRVRQLFNKKENSGLVDSLAHNAPCPVCEKNTDYEARYIAVFSDKLTDDKFASAFKDSAGLCLDHFMQSLDRSTSQSNTQILVEMQTVIWERLKFDLSEFVRKYDFNNAHEAIGAEGNSWLRAVRQMSGEKGVFGLRTDTK